jgi:hypothetical protein
MLGLSNGTTATLPKADVCICFNAGVWGYSDWLPTLQLLLQGESKDRGKGRDVGCPLVLTSYNAREAEDDLEVLWAMNIDVEETRCLQHRQQVSVETMHNAAVLWGPALNPFRSLERRMCDGLPNELMFENWCWLCLAPPHVGDKLSIEKGKNVKLATLAALDPHADERKGRDEASLKNEV